LSTDHYKNYIKGILSAVFAYTLIDIFFTILYAVIIGGLFSLYAFLIGDFSLIKNKQILVCIQVFLGFYFVAISVTSFNAYIKFKKSFKTSTEE
jgi:hypothetical protein